MSSKAATLESPQPYDRDTIHPQTGKGGIPQPEKTLADTAETLLVFEDHTQQKAQLTTCYMCACRCGIKVTVENDKTRFIEGNKNHPINRGVRCAKGAAGIMKQESPGKLRFRMRRVPGTERGAGEFEAISRNGALDMFTNRLRALRQTDPNPLAFFTGRDQMQALTGLWTRGFGYRTTPRDRRQARLAVFGGLATGTLLMAAPGPQSNVLSATFAVVFVVLNIVAER
jgi:anaerobic selenocysteine-containing dehydrogenase